jgi:hypothetical protein
MVYSSDCICIPGTLSWKRICYPPELDFLAFTRQQTNMIGSTSIIAFLSTCAIAAAQVTGQLGDAQVVTNNPAGAAYQATLTGKVTGSVKATSEAGKAVSFTVEVKGLPVGTGPFSTSCTTSIQGKKKAVCEAKVADHVAVRKNTTSTRTRSRQTGTAPVPAAISTRICARRYRTATARCPRLARLAICRGSMA